MGADVEYDIKCPICWKDKLRVFWNHPRDENGKHVGKMHATFDSCDNCGFSGNNIPHNARWKRLYKEYRGKKWNPDDRI